MSIRLHACRLWQATATFTSGTAPKRKKQAATNTLIWLSLSSRVGGNVRAKARAALLHHTGVAFASGLAAGRVRSRHEAP